MVSAGIAEIIVLKTNSAFGFGKIEILFPAACWTGDGTSPQAMLNTLPDHKNMYRGAHEDGLVDGGGVWGVFGSSPAAAGGGRGGARGGSGS